MQQTELQLRQVDDLRQAGRYDEAITCLQTLLQANPQLAAAHNNLGLLWGGKHDYPKAVACFREAIRIRSDFAEAYCNLGTVLVIHGDLEGGEAAIQEALRIKPDFALAHLNRAAIWLRKGDFERGLPEFEWRRLGQANRSVQNHSPLWNGAVVADSSILLSAEHGIGDTVQFIRYASLVKRRCALVVFQCDKSLVPLLQRCPGIDRLIPRGETPPQCHFHAPLMSLPLLLGTTLATIPAQMPYVFPEQDLVVAWQGRLASHRGFRVGISWQGNPHYPTDNLRSIPLRHFQSLAQIPGVTLFSLQKNAGLDQLAGVDATFPITHFGPGFDTLAGTLMDTAAVMRNLDLIITSDTAVAHLAGAMGVPVWVTLSKSADWRWLEHREDSPWYPTMRLFRQERLGDWEGVFRRITAAVIRVRDGDRSELLPPPRPSRLAVTVPLGAGELLDRIAILTIKCRRMPPSAAGADLERQLRELKAACDRSIPRSPALDTLSTDLQTVNESLWDIEDRIRLCEQRKDFGPEFVELARSVYRTNDHRAKLKRGIDELVGSDFTDVKHYAAEERPGAVASRTPPADAVSSPVVRDGKMEVFYINLARRTDRNDEFLRRNGSIVECRRVEGINGESLQIEEAIERGLVAAPFDAYSQGTLACALSHRELWMRAVATGAPVTVAEDDAVLNRQFSQRAREVMARLPADWDIILWGWNFNSILHVEVIPGLKQGVGRFDPSLLRDRQDQFQSLDVEPTPLRLLGAFGTLCYSISPKGAQLLATRCFPLRNEVVPVPGLQRNLKSYTLDVLLNKHYPAVKAFVSLPPLAWSENDKATSSAFTPDGQLR